MTASSVSDVELSTMLRNVRHAAAAPEPR
jgi:hypothetical protein